MKLSTRRTIYYTSVIIALVAILCSAVIINRTFVNTPQYSTAEVAEDAGAAVNAYMAYVGDMGEVVVGIVDAGELMFEDVVAFVENATLADKAELEIQPPNEDLCAWVVLYDDQNRCVHRMNFFENGNLVCYDDEWYNSEIKVMSQLIEYCNKAALEND